MHGGRPAQVLRKAQDALLTLALLCLTQPIPHTSGSSLDDSVIVLCENQKPDHFVVHMNLDLCASEPIKDTPKEGEMRGSEMERQTPGQGFTAEPGSLVFSKGTIRDHPCTGDQSHVLPACLILVCPWGEGVWRDWLGWTRLGTGPLQTLG